jgi:YesN/AraC family two-component response regulator
MPYRLIIIDDEKEISSGFARFFPWKDLGFEITGQFSGARSALQYILHNPVDVVVTDVLMPGMTGIDLAKELAEREFNPRPVVILFSAYDEFEYVHEALKYHCTDYILKTTEYNELITIFQNLKEKIDKERKNAEIEKANGLVLCGDKIITVMKQYVKDKLKTANLQDASREVFLSPSYASRYFKQRTGENFSEYLLKERMIRACEMLCDLKYKIYEISDLLGYNLPMNFTRSFKKFYGKSPLEYRFQKLRRTNSGDGVENQ